MRCLEFVMGLVVACSVSSIHPNIRNVSKGISKKKFSVRCSPLSKSTSCECAELVTLRHIAVRNEFTF